MGQDSWVELSFKDRRQRAVQGYFRRVLSLKRGPLKNPYMPFSTQGPMHQNPLKRVRGHSKGHGTTPDSSSFTRSQGLGFRGLVTVATLGFGEPSLGNVKAILGAYSGKLLRVQPIKGPSMTPLRLGFRVEGLGFRV